MRENIKYVLFGAGLYVCIDVIGFIAWALSGQVPPDSMFLGMVTKSIISIII